MSPHQEFVIILRMTLHSSKKSHGVILDTPMGFYFFLAVDGHFDHRTLSTEEVGL